MNGSLLNGPEPVKAADSTLGMHIGSELTGDGVMHREVETVIC